MKSKRIISLLLVVSMLIAFYIPVGAAYENTYINKGNQAVDILGVAKTQIGYAEGSNNYTKYGVWYGSPNTAWCAIFISWCANQANVPTSVIPKFAGCESGISWFKERGRWKDSKYHGGSYVPSPGDLIFYDWDYNGSCEHVGLVESVSGSAINTIEGNYTDKVGRRTNVSLSSKDILGYGVPNYNGATVVTNSTSTYKIKATPYLIIREGPAMSYDEIGRVPDGETVTVDSISGNWGKVTYGGVTGYICLDFATPVAATLSSISVATKPTKTEYVVGEELSTEGMVVKAIYSDGSTKTVTSYSVSGFSSDTTGEKKVTVTYSGKTTTFTVNVSKAYTTGTYKVIATALNLRSGAGENFGIYTEIPNGTTVNVTEVSSVWGKVSYSSYTGWVSMKYLEAVAEKKLASIKITSKPSKLNYYVGDTVDKTGLVVTAVYSDLSTANITSYSLSGFSTTSAGTKTVTVTYSGKTATFDITVSTPAITLSATTLDMYDTQTTILEATTKPSTQNISWTSSSPNVVSVSGGLLTAVKDGSSTITASFTYNGVKYSAKCVVTVITRVVSSIEIKALPKTDYTDGEALSTNGLTLKVNYDKGSSTTITSGFTVSGFDSEKIGTQTLTVKYMDKTATYDVKVRADFVPFRTVEYDGHIYSFYNENLTYLEALEKCKAMGGHLVSISSDAEQQMINKELLSGKNNNYWIGLSDRNGSAGKYAWETGETLSYTNWIDKQPNAGTGTNGVAIQLAYGGKWNDLPANNENYVYGFICEIDAQNVMPGAVKKHGNNTYYRFDGQITWTDAKALCEMLGGHLVSVTTDDENDFVADFASDGKADSYWIGASDLSNKGNFSWITGEVFSYSDWIGNNPDNTNSCEHFVEMSRSDSFKWNDVKNLGRDGKITGFILEVEGFEINLSETDITLVAGYNSQLTATVSGNIYYSNEIEWKSTNKNVATVNENGTVTAVSAGTALIVAEINGVAVYCKVTVIGKTKSEVVALAVQSITDEKEKDDETTSD